MNHENLIISNEWSLNDDETELKIVHGGQESIYKPSRRDVISSIHTTRKVSIYFVFDDDAIALMYDADTGIIRPLRVNKENILVADYRSLRSSHVSTKFTRFLFGEFLRNRGVE